MTSPQPTGNLAVDQSPRTLRAIIEQYRATGTPMPLNVAVDLIVPLCVELAGIHQQGYGVYVYPSNLVTNAQGGLSLSRQHAGVEPQLPQDRACLAPETQPGQLGSARGSVYSIGAILYEMVTGASAGPGMRRPRELLPSLPPALEDVLARALIAQPNHRPEDLMALAQALYGLSPKPTIAPPPPADPAQLNHAGDLMVDVSLSMMPPAAPSSNGAAISGARPALGIAVAAAPASAPNGADVATAQLAALKARLEADPSPRYVVIKEGMDHGPFNAVELLQQIRTSTFVETDLVQDAHTGTETVIKEHPDFAPFAEHAKRHRDIVEEKAAIDRGVAQENKRTKGKALIGIAVVAALLASAGAWFLTQRGTRNDEVAIHTEKVSNIEAEGAVKVKKKPTSAGRRVTGSKGGIPVLAGGQSCQAAQAAYVEEMKMTGGGQADITRGQYASIMNNGSYFAHCGVPSNVAVSICAAVQNGRAVGVTVTTKPNHSSRSCIASAVRKKSFPSHPKLDVVRVQFAAE